MSVSMPGLAADGTNDICVTLLGTAGGPMGMSDRAGISSLVSAGGKHYLVDAGDGVTRQLAAVALTGHDVGAVFLTHLHDDHTAGLPGLASFYYTTRGESMTVLGPPGTRALVDGLVAFLQPNADIRNVENKLKHEPRDVISAREIGPGPVFSDETVRVTAADNTHYVVSAEAFEGKQRTYALRFDVGDASIVLTGDTGISEDVTAMAEGADIVVAEMASFNDIESVPPFVREHMVREHMSPAQVGQLAAEVDAGRLVLSHVRDVSPADIDEISRHYDGPVAAGQDLDRFCVSAGD
jgi:ribonuclease BN (tRNA processing enzyme)